MTKRVKTLERLIAKAGIGTRRDARALVATGRVTVDGIVERDPDRWLDPESTSIAIDGRAMPSGARRYLALHKPVGVLTTRTDPAGRRTIYELLPAGSDALRYVGRLDRDTSGLLLLTDDTDFLHHVSSPAGHVPKTYRVTAEGHLDDHALARLREGVDLDDGPTRPAEVILRERSDELTSFDLIITEGRNRQVRRMVAAVGSQVVALHRVAIGSVHLGDLAEGLTRSLSADEIESLVRS